MFKTGKATTVAAALTALTLFALLTATFPKLASAQEPIIRDRGNINREDGRRDRERGNPGLGLGIDLGIRLLERTKPEAEPRDKSAIPSKKTSKSRTTKKSVQQDIKFVGKPDSVVHNPKHRVGKLGDLRDHKQVVIEKNGHYFKRHYYYTRSGERLTWYWYDDPVPDKDPVLATLKDIPACEGDSDDCDDQPLARPPEYIQDKPPTNTPANPPAVARTPDTCEIIGSGEILDTAAIDCHGHKGKITVEKNVTLKPIPSAPKLAKLKAEGSKVDPTAEKTGQFSIKYTGTPCEDCRWIQFFWEEVLIKREGKSEFEELPPVQHNDPKDDRVLSSSSKKDWSVDSMAAIVYVGFGADYKALEKNPAYCIENFSLGLREYCEPGKDGTEQIFDRPSLSNRSVFSRIIRQIKVETDGEDAEYEVPNVADVIQIKQIIHFETYLICAQEICAKVCWQANFEWTKGMDEKPTENLSLDDCKIETTGVIDLNPDQKLALLLTHPDQDLIPNPPPWQVPPQIDSLPPPVPQPAPK